MATFHTITIAFDSSIYDMRWVYIDANGNQTDSGTWRASWGTFTYTASGQKLVIYPHPASGYEHPTYFERTSPTYYFQTVTSNNGTTDGGTVDRDISYTADKSGTLSATRSTPSTCTITFDPNGGSPSYSETIAVGSSLYLGNYTPTRAGYNLSGWLIDGETFRTTATVTFIQTKTIYAQWRLKTYTVHFDANGGTGAPADQTKTHGVTLTLSSTIPTRTNYTFKNWFDGTDYYEAGGPYTPNSPATLFAQWEHITCALFYWHGSDAADAAKFAARQPVQDALTAAAWNSMITKVNELRGLLGQSTIQIPAVSAGERIGAVAFNRLRYIIADTIGAGTLPATVSEGDRITTGLFNGPGSLKAALNTAIEAFNNS